MANKTIHGCVNRTTGEITFKYEACDTGDYKGCIVRSGDHAGQVAITFSEVNCEETTYYGCINRSTGEFDVLIPDNCCQEACTCSSKLRVTLMDIIPTGCVYCWLAGIHKFYYSFTGNPNGVYEFTWAYCSGSATHHNVGTCVYSVDDPTCSDDSYETDEEVSVSWNSGTKKLTILAMACDILTPLFKYVGTLNDIANLPGTYANQVTGDCAIGSGGYAIIACI
jgi:hypothetical protein